MERMTWKSGMHIGVIYQGLEELIYVLTLFILSGLQQDEKVCLITSDDLIPQLQMRLTEKRESRASLSHPDQLVFLSGFPIPMTASQLTAWVRQEIDQALMEGYRGLWIAIGCDCVDEAGRNIRGDPELEAALDEGLNGQLCTVLCSFRRDDLTDAQWWSLLSSHLLLVAAPKLRTGGESLGIEDLAYRRRVESEAGEPREKPPALARELETVLDTIPLPVIFSNREGQIQMANEAARKLWQRPLVGEMWQTVAVEQSLVDPRTGRVLDPDQCPMARALRGEMIRDLELNFVQQDEYCIPVMFDTTPVQMEDGGVVGAILIGQDLTRLRAADQIKDRFLAMVSHDLRAPLATIRGWALMAQETADPGVIHRALDLILQGTKTQQRLIDDLLDAAALAAGVLRVTPEVQDIRSIVHFVCLGAQAVGNERGIKLEWSLPDEVVMVRVDAVRLQQILGNLITRAFQSTLSGDRIEVSLSGDVEYAILQIRHTGAGIEPENLRHVFDRFYGELNGTSWMNSGGGVSLALVKSLVELHEGMIMVASDGLHQGATFTVRLPLVLDPLKG